MMLAQLMASRRTRLRVLILSVVGLALCLSAALLTLVPSARVGIVRNILPGVCSTEDWKTVLNLDGVRFDATYVNCDFIAKEDSVTIYASSRSQRMSPFIRNGLGIRRRYLFMFRVARKPFLSRPPTITQFSFQL